jgi:hypothetical protein
MTNGCHRRCAARQPHCTDLFSVEHFAISAELDDCPVYQTSVHRTTALNADQELRTACETVIRFVALRFIRRPSVIIKEADDE